MKNIVFLICITVIAIFLRLNNLGSVPPNASLDEVSIGYNAYSIFKTGADEYGTKLPILLRAYDDWRPALYIYLVVPFIKLFGLNVLAVRLPSVILSVLTIVAVYLLTCELIRMSKLRINVNTMGLISSFILAISPWHIYISRLGHEVNAGLSFVIFAVLFFLKAINSKKSLFLILSSIFFGLSLYTYQSEKVFVPLIVLILILIYRKSLLELKKTLLVSLAIGIIIITPITLATFSSEGLARFKGTSAFTGGPFYRESADRVLKYKNEGNLLGQIINNRRLVPLKIFAANYLSHFNPKFLFSNSGNESFKAPNFGLMYVWELPFLLIGLVYIFITQGKKTKLLLISWLLIAFVAPSLTTGAPHAMRSYNILPIPQILISLGILKALKSRFLYLGIVIIVIYFLINFYREYFYSFPKTQSSSFQYSLHSAIKFVLNNEKSYNKVIFSNYDNLYQSYMFCLFNSRYDPFSYQKQGGTASGGFEEAHKFGKYEFRPIVWNKDKTLKNALLIGNTREFPTEITPLASFTNLDGKGEIKVVKN